MSQAQTESWCDQNDDSPGASIITNNSEKSHGATSTQRNQNKCPFS